MITPPPPPPRRRRKRTAAAPAEQIDQFEARFWTEDGHPSPLGVLYAVAVQIKHWPGLLRLDAIEALMPLLLDCLEREAGPEYVTDGDVQSVSDRLERHLAILRANHAAAYALPAGYKPIKVTDLT
jgi:hypothetical protein